MKNLNSENIIGIVALLVHAAKIDEKYSDKEKTLIKEFIKSFSESNDEEVLKKAEEIENNSNQLLSFTNIVKKK
jgi:uncharacterized tellurite resistance protein B-like protein